MSVYTVGMPLLALRNTGATLQLAPATVTKVTERQIPRAPWREPAVTFTYDDTGEVRTLSGASLRDYTTSV